MPLNDPPPAQQPQVEHYQLDGVGMTVDHCTPTREQQVRWFALQAALTIKSFAETDIDEIIKNADAFESYLLNGKSEVN